MRYRSKVKAKDRIAPVEQSKTFDFKYKFAVFAGIFGFVAGIAGTLIYWTSGQFGYKISSVFKYMLRDLFLFGFFFMLIGGFIGCIIDILLNKRKKK